MRRLSALFLFLFLSSPFICFAQGAHRIGQALVKGNGLAANVAPYAKVTVCVVGTDCAQLAPTFTDPSMMVPLQQPVVADGSGNYSYYIVPGCVDEKISTPGQGQFFLTNVCPDNGQIREGSGTVSNGTVGQIAQYPATGIEVEGATVSGDCLLAVGGGITCTKTNGVPFGPFATASGLPGNVIVSNPTVAQTITQPVNTSLSVITSGTGQLQYKGSEVLTTATGVLTSPATNQAVNQPPGTNLSITNGIFQNKPFRCAEWYLPLDTVHSGTDYGVAISQANLASDPLTPTEVKLCTPGDHPIFTPAVLNRPIHLVGTGSRLIPQNPAGGYFTNSVIAKAASTASSSSSVVSTGSTTGLAVGMACGGVGIPPGAYITALTSTAVTLSLPPRLIFYAVATAGSSTLAGISSLSGVTTSQSLTGSGSKWPYNSGTVAINSINAASNTITLASAADNGSPVPDSFIVSGNWTTDLACVNQSPVIVWNLNVAPGTGTPPSNSLKNQYFFQIGAYMEDVWIADNTNGGLGRSLPGVQGVQIYGFDGFVSKNLRVDNLIGSGLILGGYMPGQVENNVGAVRESAFLFDEIRDSGDPKTGQAALALFTGHQGANPNVDEINTVEFSGGRYVCSAGPAVAVGTYNPTRAAGQGPRGLFFDTGFQIEGCPQGLFDSVAQSDSIYVANSGNLRFANGSISIPGTGKSLLRLEKSGTLAMTNVSLFNQSISTTWSVGVVNGSTTVTYISGGGTVPHFNTEQTWDGMGVLIGSTLMHLKGVSPVVAGGATLQLASPWTGSTSTQTMTIGFGGAFIFAPDTSMFRLDVKGSQTTGNDANTNTLLGITNNDYLFEAGNNFDGSVGSLTTYDDFNGTRTTQGPFSWRIGGAIDTTKNGAQIQYNLNGSAETDIITQKANLGGGLCLYSVAPNATPSSPSNCFTGTGGLTLKDKVINSLGQDTDGIRLTPFSDATIFHDIYGTNAANSAVNWSIQRTGFNVGPSGTYSFNGTPGFTGTKSGAACVFTIQGGIITNVTGC